MCLRGISVFTAFGPGVEIGDYDGLAGHRIGIYLGPVPFDHSAALPSPRLRSPRP